MAKRQIQWHIRTCSRLKQSCQSTATCDDNKNTRRNKKERTNYTDTHMLSQAAEKWEKKRQSDMYIALYENARARSFSRSFVRPLLFDVGNTELKIYIVIECHKELKTHCANCVFHIVNSYLVWCLFLDVFSFSSFFPVNNFRFSLCDNKKGEIAL